MHIITVTFYRVSSVCYAGRRPQAASIVESVMLQSGFRKYVSKFIECSYRQEPCNVLNALVSSEQVRLCRWHTHRDSPGGSMWRGQRTFWPDSKEDRRTYFTCSVFQDVNWSFVCLFVL